MYDFDMQNVITITRLIVNQESSEVYFFSYIVRLSYHRLTWFVMMIVITKVVYYSIWVNISAEIFPGSVSPTRSLFISQPHMGRDLSDIISLHQDSLRGLDLVCHILY